MTPREFKQRFLIALFSRDEWTRKVNDVQYRTRCPYCGDSQKDLNTGHFYVRCDINDNYPIVYICFKCSKRGVLTKETLSLLGINSDILSASVSTIMRNSISAKAMSFQNESQFKIFPFEAPPLNHKQHKIQYIEKRLGFQIDDSIAKEIRLIPSLKDFLAYNQIGSIPCNQYVAERIEENYIGFLSYGNSHILFRDVTEHESISWLKFPIVSSSIRNGVAYSIEGFVDIFTDDTIYINLTEGIMDIISVCYNLGYHMDNCVNMCVCGKKYDRWIKRLITQGIYGYNVILNIFADNDKDFNPKKENYDTTIEYYRKSLSRYTIMFKEINVYYNLAQKDCGTRIENIRLKKYRI